MELARPEGSAAPPRPPSRAASGAGAWRGASMSSEEIAYVPIEDAPLRGAMAIVGISGLRSAGSLVARSLIARLGMDLVGAFHSERLLPAGASHHGVMTSTVQVWRAQVACGLDGVCSELLVVKNDLPVEVAAMAPLARAVTRWAAEGGLSLLLGFDSYPAPEKSGTPEVLVAASPAARDLAGSVPARPLDDTIVVGFAAALLASANRDAVRAIVLFGPRGAPAGDSVAAAPALRAARPLLPDLGYEQVVLEDELGRLETELLREIEAALAGGGLDQGFKGYA